MPKLLGLRLFGAFEASDADGRILTLGTKQQALLALLALSRGGSRTRAFLESLLWSASPPEQAKASLRTALSVTRQALGPAGSRLITANRERVHLDLAAVDLCGSPADGVVMEGFDLPHEEAFEDWLRAMRAEHPSVSLHHAATVGQTTDSGRLALDPLLPTIAVLPFVNRAGDGSLDPMGSVLAEELSRYLSRTQGFSVTSYLTTRKLHAPSLEPAEVAQTCGVRYMVNGTVAVAGGKFRLVADLQDARHGRLIWSREFGGSVRAVLAGETGALAELTTQIGRTVTGEAVRLARSTPLAALENHTLLMAGIAMLQDPAPAVLRRAREVFEFLLEREPKHPITLTWLGFWHVMQVQTAHIDDRAATTRLADELADRALAIDPAFSLAQTLKGMIASHLLGRFDIGQSTYNLALADNPNESLALLLKGAMRAFESRGGEAVALTEAAQRLSPLDPQRYYFDALTATAYLAAGDFAHAVALADRSLKANPLYPSTLRTRIIALQMSGQGGEARRTTRQLLAAVPGFSVSRYRAEHPAGGLQAGRIWGDALRDAGVPK